MDLLGHQRLIVHHMLTRHDSLVEIAEQLRENQFPDPLYGSFFGVLVRAYSSERHPHTFESLLESISRRSGDEEAKQVFIDALVGTREFVGTTPADLHQSINAVQQEYRRVVLLRALQSAATDIEGGREANAEQAFSQALDQLQNVGGHSQPCVHVSEAVNDSIARYDRAAAGLNPPGVPTGFSRIDAATGGMKPGHIWLLGAAPSQGKTAVAKEITYNAAQAGYAVLYCSLEMAEDEILRLLHVRHANAAIAGEPVPLRGAADGTLSATQAEIYRAAIADFANRDIMVWAPFSASLRDIGRRIAAIRAVRRLDLVVIDYLQLVRSEDRRGQMREEKVEVLQEVKRLARSHRIPILALWQMSRDAAKDAADLGYYEMTGLGDTSEAERTADVILWSLYPPAMEKERELKLGLAKVRHGQKMIEGYRLAAMMDIAMIVEHQFDEQFQ